MANNTIALTEVVFLELKTLERHINDNPTASWKPSASRVVDYLLNLWREMDRALREGREIKDAKQCALHYENRIMDALSHKPPVRSRGVRSRSHYASFEERVIVAQELKQRLGIDDPDPRLINEFINAGGLQKIDPIRRQVLLRQGNSARPTTGREQGTSDDMKNPSSGSLTPSGQDASNELPSEAAPASDTPPSAPQSLELPQAQPLNDSKESEAT